jgi:hypothetical protein
MRRAKRTRTKRDDRIPDEVKFYAKLAEAAYKDDEHRQKAPKNWIYAPEHSSAHHAVYVNETDKEVITAFRGTQVDDLKDIQSDIAIVAHQRHAGVRFKDAEKDFSSILSEYPAEEYDHILTGHSLGGSISTHIEQEFDEVSEVHNFNPGVGAAPLNPFAAVFQKKKPHVHDYIIKGDPISVFGTMMSPHDVEVYDANPDKGHPHTIKQFLD